MQERAIVEAQTITCHLDIAQEPFADEHLDRGPGHKSRIQILLKQQLQSNIRVHESGEPSGEFPEEKSPLLC